MLLSLQLLLSIITVFLRGRQAHIHYYRIMSTYNNLGILELTHKNRKLDIVQFYIFYMFHGSLYLSSCIW